MSNGQEVGGVQATPQEEMEAFDRLPPDARALLNCAHINYSAKQLARASTGGVQTCGGFTISRPNEQAALLAKIAETEAQFIPLKALRNKTGRDVARATLRPLLRGRMFSRRSA